MPTGYCVQIRATRRPVPVASDRSPEFSCHGSATTRSHGTAPPMLPARCCTLPPGPTLLAPLLHIPAERKPLASDYRETAAYWPLAGLGQNTTVVHQLLPGYAAELACRRSCSADSPPFRGHGIWRRSADAVAPQLSGRVCV